MVIETTAATTIGSKAPAGMISSVSVVYLNTAPLPGGTVILPAPDPSTVSLDKIAVLRRSTHGMPIDGYAAALRERFPDRDVALARTRTEEEEVVGDADIVTSKGINEDLLALADDLRLFACYSAGYEHLPLDDLADRGIAVTNGSGIHAPNIAEHVIGNILVFSRRFHEGWRRQRSHEWRHYRADELKGETVTVVGLGAIGTATVERLEPFGVKTIGVRYTPEKGGPTDEVVGFESAGFESALARTDYLVLTCPLTDTTAGLIGTAEFETLSPSSVLVNVARGGVVGTEALVDAVRDNELRGAYLDVTDPEPLPKDHELWGFENVLITPHMAGHTPEYYERCADILARNVVHVEECGDWTDLENQVVAPNL